MRHSPPLVSLLALFAAPVLGADPTPQQVEFFEKKIRPVLSEHCYGCHGDEAAKKKKLKGGLQLDTAAGLRAGGDSGPAVDAKTPADSLLLKSLRYDGDVKMPPKGKLPDAVIADVEAWVAMGTPDPRGGAVAKKQVGMSVEDGRKFWAYQPVPASVNREATPSAQIDSLIRKKLEEAKLAPAPLADKAVLVRRLYFDLWGLPPTPEQIDAFVTSQDPAAYEKLVDDLLASPRFGERWARHWFDVSRYAESLTLRGFILKEAWRYRDYVIDTFNADRPFTAFIREQIAGDLLPHTSPDERQRNLVATAFLAMGNNNLEEQDKKQLRMDVVDEMLDVVSKGFLAQTVTCARCHDHKFDPIPTKDYYALAGILRNAKALEHANVSNWIEVPLPVDAEREKELKAFEARVAAVQAKIAAAGTAAKGVLAVADVPGVVIDDAAAKKVGTWKDSTHSGSYIGAGYTHDDNAAKGEKSITFQTEVPANGRYEVRLAYSHGGSRATNAPVTVFSADGEKELSIDMTKPPPVDGRWVSLGEFAFEKSGQSFVIVSNEGTKGHVTADAVVFLSTDKKAEKPATADAKKGDKKPADDVKAMEEELKKMQASGPKRPKALSVTEEAKIEDARVHVRGLVGNQGEVAPRGFLQVATAGAMPELPKGQSGRKELADWIASEQNPLTARVYVNRTWHWLMGRGLVRTPDNFGVTGETPTHPELLDFLAAAFMANPDREVGGMGWSTKKLVRAIVLSETYRRSSNADAKADPENKLWGRATRKRMEAEQIRDTLLSVSGQLKLDPVSGPTYPASTASDYAFKQADARRSVYLPVFRNSLPEVFEVFDFADASVVTGQRNTSTVAPQALYFLNNPFPVEQAKASAERLLGEKLSEDERITRAYRLTLGREPTAGERGVTAKFVNGKADADTWAAVFQALFASAEFRYVD
jgi:hypothetical protein